MSESNCPFVCPYCKENNIENFEIIEQITYPYISEYTLEESETTDIKIKCKICKHIFTENF